MPVVIWFRAALTIFILALSTTSLASLPEGFHVNAGANLVLTERLHETCIDCVVLEIRNPTQTPLAVEFGIEPLTVIEAEDRSFGGWVYSYSHELLNIGGEVQVAPEEGQTPVHGIATRRRFELRALSVHGDPVDYHAGSFNIALTIPPESQRLVTAYNGRTIAKKLRKSPPERYLYWTLWQPLRQLCLWVEKTISWLLPGLGAFGMILHIVVVVRAITFPVNRWSFRSQQHFEAIQKSIAPEIADIKSRLKGGDQSEAILELYQSRGVNPLSGLKGSVGLFVQIPILIAMFNVASDSALFSGGIDGLGKRHCTARAQFQLGAGSAIAWPVLQRHRSWACVIYDLERTVQAGTFLWFSIVCHCRWGVALLFPGLFGGVLVSDHSCPIPGAKASL